jgi:hypothetical protein
MSSREMTTHTSTMSEKMSFMNLWKVAGVLVSPNGMTSIQMIHNGFGMQFSICCLLQCVLDGRHVGGRFWYKFVLFLECPVSQQLMVKDSDPFW